MLEELFKIEKRLPFLLSSPSDWNSLYIDYEFPIVERVWRQIGELRISLHRIHTCEEGQSFFHTHPWPSAMRILSGTYEMHVGYNEENVQPPVAMTTHLTAGCAYEMINPNGWHTVRPINEPTISLMVTGKPWGNVVQKDAPKMGPLTLETKIEIIDLFKGFYR